MAQEAAEEVLLAPEEALPCDDDLSEQEEEPVTPRRSLASRLADCKAKLVELQGLKAQRLQEEDYMGAHEAKERIQEQEQMLQARDRGMSLDR